MACNELNDAATTADKMIGLFNEFSEWFGLSDNDWPEEKPEAKQCEFEDKFNLLICEYKGHDIGPDQCGKPEHDLCYRCRELRVDLGISDFRKGG